tara:strand:+ start:4494 stop:4901 length:408 start_codon:yes stop_codon:yes gene_type:complete
MQDVAEAMITHLKTVSAITDLTSTRIWGGDLPETEVENMPRQNLVVRESGGPEEFRTARIQQQRLDFFSYGEGYYQAGQVDRAVADALIAIARTVANSTLMHSAGYGGAMHLKLSDSGWEYVLRSALIMVGETST